MANGQDFLNDIELEKEIKNMKQRELLEFTAREVYKVKVVSSSNKERIKALESRDKKFLGTVGIVGAVIGGVIAGVADYFIRR